MKDFFTKKENIFILATGAACLLLVLIGFLFLFFKPDTNDGPKKIPATVSEIVWDTFSSDIISDKIEYPEHLRVSQQEDQSGTGITFAEFEPEEFLTYFSNQNHVSIYPDGISAPLSYGKTREDEYVSTSGQVYQRIEHLTSDNEVWGVMLVPKTQYKDWQSRGFVWIQARIKDRETLCVSESGAVTDSVDCDPFVGQKTVYSGTVSDQFIRTGYEIVNKNSFK